MEGVLDGEEWMGWTGLRGEPNRTNRTARTTARTETEAKPIPETETNRGFTVLGVPLF